MGQFGLPPIVLSSIPHHPYRAVNGGGGGGAAAAARA